jgi:hypothetical protein
VTDPIVSTIPPTTLAKMRALAQQAQACTSQANELLLAVAEARGEAGAITDVNLDKGEYTLTPPDLPKTDKADAA